MCYLLLGGLKLQNFPFCTTSAATLADFYMKTAPSHFLLHSTTLNVAAVSIRQHLLALRDLFMWWDTGRHPWRQSTMNNESLSYEHKADEMTVRRLFIFSVLISVHSQLTIKFFSDFGNCVGYLGLCCPSGLWRGHQVYATLVPEALQWPFTDFELHQILRLTLWTCSMMSGSTNSKLGNCYYWLEALPQFKWQLHCCQLWVLRSHGEFNGSVNL